MSDTSITVIYHAMSLTVLYLEYLDIIYLHVLIYFSMVHM